MIAGAKRRPYVLILAINPKSGKGHARKRAIVAKDYFAGLGFPVEILEGHSLDDFREKFVLKIEHESISGVVAFGGEI